MANSIDTKKTDWLNVKQFCLDQLTEMRSDNDGNLDMSDTARLRGKIEFAKEILRLGETQIKIEVEDTQYIE